MPWNIRKANCSLIETSSSFPYICKKGRRRPYRPKSHYSGRSSTNAQEECRPMLVRNHICHTAWHFMSRTRKEKMALKCKKKPREILNQNQVNIEIKILNDNFCYAQIGLFFLHFTHYSSILLEIAPYSKTTLCCQSVANDSFSTRYVQKISVLQRINSVSFRPIQKLSFVKKFCFLKS